VLASHVTDRSCQGPADMGLSQEHTGTQVRIAAQGPFAYRVLGVTNQTDLFATIREALRLR
jgi:alkaline phosphatase/streptomycin-6-phosphatase